jgi:hypothetical protein
MPPIPAGETGVRKRIGNLRWLPWILAAVHAAICLAVALGLVEGEGSWGWFFVFLIDFPASAIVLLLGKVVSLNPLVAFGLVGTAWWYAVGKFLAGASSRKPEE